MRNLSNINYDFILENNEVVKGESVSRQQMLREAYKGAIRNVTHFSNGALKTFNQEILRIDRIDKVITVRKVNDAHLQSKPISQTHIHPNFNKERRFKTISCGEARIFNLELYEKVSIKGYKRGYFNKFTTAVMYEHPFIDTLRTTGVVIFHPALNRIHVERGKIARLVFESFLMRNAFDRNDISQKSDRLYVPNRAEELDSGEHFIALYDLNRLNITTNLIKKDILNDTFGFLHKNYKDFVDSLFPNGINEITEMAIIELCKSILNNELLDQEYQENSNLLTIYAPMTMAYYWAPEVSQESNDTNMSEDEDAEDYDDDENWKPCQIIAVNKDSQPQSVKYTIFFNNKCQPNISLEELKPRKDTKYSKFDWEKGLLVNE